MAHVLHAQGLFLDLPLVDLFEAKKLMVSFVQDAWHRFLTSRGIEVATVPLAETDNNLSIPFDHPDVRVFVDSMFLEGTLQPVTVKGTKPTLPDWVKAGIIDDPHAVEQLVVEGAKRISAELPDIEANYREWAQLAGRLGETIHRFHGLPQERATSIEPQIRKMQLDVD